MVLRGAAPVIELGHRQGQVVEVMTDRLVYVLVLTQRRKVTVKLELAWQTGGRVGHLPRSLQIIRGAILPSS